MSATVTPLDFQPQKAPEDEARAGYYALLARLFYGGPDARLLETIGGSGEPVAEAEPTPLAMAWNALASAARAADAEAARLEYDQLYVGTGKAPVTPYASFYLTESGREKILVRIRQELDAMGLAKSDSAREPEDHVSGLFEIMRHLISKGSDDAALQKQRDFFERYLERSLPPFCNAICVNEKADFYRHVARFAQAFFVVETEALKVF
ncbi:MAG: molecular chaperone TorD family protein [Burkholderiales bacterium]